MLAKLALVCIFAAYSVAKEVKIDEKLFKGSYSKDCDNNYSATCLKLDIVSWVDRLNEKEDFSVVPGVSIVRENSSARANTDIFADLAREFPNNPDGRLDAYLLEKVQGFLSSHSIKLNLAEKDDDNAVTARKRKRGGNGMGMFLAMAAMMKSTLYAIGLGTLAALAGKALMTSLISLLLSAIIGLKSLTSGGGQSTYEVIAKPSHDDHHHGRSFDEPLPLGLRPEYKPA